MEILAPAGSPELLYAAVEAGADAVYLGGKLFSARRFAGNFTNEEMEEAVHFCHARNVAVYVTFEYPDCASGNERCCALSPFSRFHCH